MPTRYRLLTGIGFVATLLIGCGGGKSAPSKVSGKVTYKGAPVTGGSLVFYSKTGGVYPNSLSSDGTYSATQLPVGDYDVTVDTESLSPNVKQVEYGGGRGPSGNTGGPGGKMASKSPPPPDRQQVSSGVYVKIPAKYAKKDTSPLKASLASGSNTKDFELTD